MPPGIKEIMQRFKQVMTIESNWSDRPEDEIIDENNRRYSSLAILLRARSWSMSIAGARSRASRSSRHHPPRDARDKLKKQ